MRFLFPSASFLLATVMVASPLPVQSPVDDSAPELQLRVIDSDGTSAQAGSHTKKSITIAVSDANGAPVGGAAVTFRLPDSGPSGKFADGSSAAVAYTDASGRAHAGDVSWSSAAGVADIRITAAKGTSHTGILFEETLTPSQTAESKPPKEVSARERPKQIAQLKMPIPPDPNSASSALPGDAPLVKRPLTPASAAAPLDQRPSVSVTGATKGASSSHSKAKWIVIAAIAIGAGAGVALATKGKSSPSSSAATTQLTIGSPTVSVGSGH